MNTVFWGKVKKGKQRGKKLGFPTANILFRKKIPHGIYISKTKINKKTHPSITFIGNAKTFEEKDIFAETYILAFNKNIYNEWVSITLIKKIRDNKKFESAEKLVEQMKKDEDTAKKYFNYV
ncbi:MAG: riboflavin kinase [bacterium]|nr:riboflavin kinase [bacterium]